MPEAPEPDEGGKERSDDSAEEPATAAAGQAADAPDPPPPGGGPAVARRLAHRMRQQPMGAPVAVILVAVVLVSVGVVAWAAWRADAGNGVDLPPGQTVSRFFHAQRDGDCEQLIDMITEDSWSDGGQRTRTEFLEQCAHAVDDYEPDVHEITVERLDDEGNPMSGSALEDEDPAETTVQIETGPRLPGDPTGEVTYASDEPPRGRLVPEGGEWRVELDDVVFSIGPRVDEVVQDYLAAYSRGDCERMLAHLTAEALASTGPDDEDPGATCADAVADREGTGAEHLPALRADWMELTVDGGDRAEAAVVPTGLGLVSFVTEGRDDEDREQQAAEVVRLVRDGLQWKLEGDGTQTQGDSAALGILPQAVAHRELVARLPGEVELDGERCFRYSNDQAPASDLMPSRVLTLSAIESDASVTRNYHGCHVGLTLFRFTDGATAETAAAELADDILADESTSLTGSRPNQEVDVPGFPDAFGAETSCSEEGCRQAESVVAHGDLVVHVLVPDGGDIDDLAGILDAQMERL